MFTGLVQAVGTVRGRKLAGVELVLQVDVGGLPGPFRNGDSIALSGACCTVVGLAAGVATFHLTGETLARTWLGQAKVGDRVNLEGALRAGEPLGGHLVQGHVDGVGRVEAAVDRARGGELVVGVPKELQKYCVEKGSITIDGVSLTIAGRRGDGAVRIAVIPHTAAVTTLGERWVGDPVHVEVDVLAKYVESLLEARGR
ncbi:MAG: riboflavin synthase [Planctomycetota bacterium]